MINCGSLEKPGDSSRYHHIISQASSVHSLLRSLEISLVLDSTCGFICYYFAREWLREAQIQELLFGDESDLDNELYIPKQSSALQDKANEVMMSDTEDSLQE